MLARRPYGASGLEMSPVAYGAMGIAHDPGLKDGVAPSLIRALERGVNLVDTARVYPGSEAIVAATLKAWRGDAPLISTKLRSADRDGYRFPVPLAQAYTSAGIRASVEESLAALQVETLDIVHMHQWHYAWTHELNWLTVLQDLKAEGKLRCIAVSVQDHEHDAALELVSRGLVDGVQVIVNLFESRPVNSLLPLAQARGVGVIARCIYDSGGLSGMLTAEDFAARTFLRHAPVALYRERAARLASSFTPHPAGDLAELALRFVLSLDGVSTAALGLTDVALMDRALDQAAKGPLAIADVARLRREHVWSKNFYEALL